MQYQLTRTPAFIFFFLLCHLCVKAQHYSYVYIQSDESTPFYVKLEGEMTPRYGKNYCIIPRLEPGEINLEILFQQNSYAPHHFVIRVPEDGYRSFLLSKRDNGFALYDLRQGFYLPNNNKASDDFLSEKLKGNLAFTDPQPAAPEPVATAASRPAPVMAKRSDAKPARQKHSFIQFKPEQKKGEQPASSGPRFIENIELSNTHAPGDAASQPSAGNGRKKLPVIASAPVAAAPAANEPQGMVNSDCPQPLPNDVVEVIYKKVMQLNEEDDRFVFLTDQLSNCYSTAQIGILTRTLDTDAARFSFLKKAYPRVSNQSQFPALEDLLTGAEWKQNFKQLTNR